LSLIVLNMQISCDIVLQQPMRVQLFHTSESDTAAEYERLLKKAGWNPII